MNDKSGTEQESTQNSENSTIKGGEQSNDFVVGLVTFIVFILFMSAWMYFSAE